jgi:hypothetical protein
VANIYQVTWEWSGFPGAPGYTNFFYDATTDSGTAALAAANKSRIFFDGVKGILDDAITLHLVTDVRVISDTDGLLQNIYTVSGVTDVHGTATSTYVSGAGMGVDWLTTVVHGRKRIMGRTFIVPAANFTTDQGAPNSTSLTYVATAAEAMRTATGPTFGIWGRPRDEEDPPNPDKPALVGVWAPATASRVPARAFLLRSRRD